MGENMFLFSDASLEDAEKREESEWGEVFFSSNAKRTVRQE